MSDEDPKPDPVPAPGRYKIGEVIGEGGMAIVREAEDTHLGRRVAVKTMRPKFSRSAEMRGRFVQEGRILAELAHPGTLPVHDAGVLETGEPFYAMQLIRGRTLSEMLDSRGLSDTQDRGALFGLVDVFERICQTMAYAHRKGIVHRDLKPANIMVDEFGALAVMDWGIAKRVADEGGDTDQTEAGVVMGTPGFMSPEQSKALDAAGEQADVFALGVILYEILTFQRPFEGASSRELMLDVLHHDPDPPRRVNPDCPRELSAICLKALAKNPRERYRDAGALAADLRKFREFRPVSAVAPRLIDRLANWARRNRALAGGVAALLIVSALAGTAVGYNRYERSRAVARVTAQIDRLRATLVSQQERLAEFREQPRSAEVERLEGELANTLLSLRGTTWALVGFTYPRQDEEILELARNQMLETNDILLGMGRHGVVAANVADLFERIAENDNYFGYTREQIDRLMRQQTEAEAGLSSN